MKTIHMFTGLPADTLSLKEISHMLRMHGDYHAFESMERYIQAIDAFVEAAPLRPSQQSNREYAETLISKIRQARDLLNDLDDSIMVGEANKELGLGAPAFNLWDAAEFLSALAGQFKELYLSE